MGPNTKKKTDDWLKDAIPVSDEEWMNAVPVSDEEWNSVFNIGPDATRIDDSADAPPMIRMEVGNLEKQDDRLKALQKHYPDARPHGEDNFIYTDEGGKVRLYNQPNWNPFNLGDFASISPEIGEFLGGAIGGTLGAVGGAAGGSAVPVIGTGIGAFGGAMAGGGTGATIGREGVQRGLNFFFGNDDTRTAGEQVVDAGQTFALNAAGEGAGMLLGKGLSAAKNAWNRRVIGEVGNVADVADAAADYRAIGVEPTVGMVSGSDRAAKLEHALIPTRKGQIIEDRINDAFTAQGDEFNRIVGGISERPLSMAEAGEALQRQAQMAKDASKARSEVRYQRVADQVKSPAVVNNTAEFVTRLTDQQAGMGEFDKLTRGTQTEQVLKQAQAIVADGQRGMDFDSLKRARTHIGQLMQDTDDRVVSEHLNGLYRALSDDMEATAAANGPEALQSFRKANNGFRRHIDSETGFGKGSTADDLLKKDSDEIFTWATSKAPKGGNRIAATRRTVERSEGGKETWNQVVAGLTDRLGRNSADEYDPGTFMRNWNKMSDEAKDAVFAGTQNAQYRKDLDRLAKIADNWTKYRKNANHSNTQAHKSSLDSLDPLSRDNLLGTALGTAAVMASGGTAVAGLAAGAAKAGAQNVTRGMARASRVKLLTNPDTVNWIANLPKAEMQKGGLKAHVRTLRKIATSTADNALAVAINEYLRDARIPDDQKITEQQ